MGAPGVREFNSKNFEAEVLKADRAVLVDFWAIWCGPCKIIAPVIDQLAADVGDKYHIGKLDIDSSSDIAARYGISAIPTLLIFKNGEVVQRMGGASLRKDDLRKALDAVG